PPPASPLHRGDWILIAVITAAGFLLRAWISRHVAVELDETVSLGYDSVWREFDGRETVMNPPLYRIIAWPVTALTGGAVLPGRWVAVVLGSATILVIARLGGLLGGAGAAIAAATLAA